ncbi:hypothetical protein [Loktanella sp. M215]|uniref:hypothetical protein n=1 Tax=Loktanella sp. M215 TaxID=2675431 RepID=UPI001F170DAB|nr:hypothetical protein [Loktanella sp. M215]MCF7702196.1 hypothetical protein [Loktanella sp. M215]
MAIAAMSCFGSGASAATVNFMGSSFFTTAINATNPGLQAKAAVVKNSGSQVFMSAPLSFGLDAVGDSFTADLFIVRTLQKALDGNDTMAKPFTLAFSFGQGTTSVSGTTYAQTAGGMTYGVIDFTNGGFINLRDGTALRVSLNDATFNAGPAGTFTPGKANGALVNATFTLSPVPVPASLPLGLSAILMMAFVAKRRKSTTV